MLVFKKNIYFNVIPPAKLPGVKEYRDKEDPGPIPFNFIYRALANAQNLFQEIEEMEDGEFSNRLEILFPHASRLGSAGVLGALSNRLFHALTDRHNWFSMNCYHQCYLYDCLLDVVEEYSYNDEGKRRELFPEMDGRELDFNRFLLEYFFNTTFLIAPERFNRMTPEEKKRLRRSPDFGEDFPQLQQFSDPDDPTLAKVINHIAPSPEDLELKLLDQNPYITV